MIFLTRSQSEYLKAIYQVSLTGDIKVTKIADYLNYSKPSVVRALKNLKILNLIEYDQKIKLTEKGYAYALNIVETDQVLFNFLTDILKVDTDNAKKDVANLKAYVSCQTIDKLETYIYQIVQKEKPNKKKMICQYHKCNICK